MSVYHLVVCVLRARNLANLDHDEHFGQSASDPYVGIFVGDQECRSTPLQDDSHPVLHKCCDFGQQSADAVIELAVADADIMGKDDVIGTGCMRANEVRHGEAKWVTLSALPGQDFTSGDVEVSTYMLPSDVGAAHGQLTVGTATASSQGGASTARAGCDAGDTLVGCSCSRDDPDAPTSFPVPDDAQDVRCASAHVLAIGADERSCVAAANVAANKQMPGRSAVKAHARCLRSPAGFASGPHGSKSTQT